MKQMVVVVAVALSCVGNYAFAGKVEDVMAEVKKSCSKDIPKEDALRLVKNLFLSCVPGDKVDVDGCKVACLKENSGAVVGQ
jgi:20S proteasome alpha/beta subunit